MIRALAWVRLRAPGRRLTRRRLTRPWLTKSLVAFATWALAIGVVLYFYDWITRWYVSVGVLLGFAAAAIVAETVKRGDHPVDMAIAEVLPIQREPESADAEWPVAAAQIA
jgi:hypothetical protein